MNRKQKCLISLAVTFVMLFSTTGIAAATGPTGPDTSPAVTADTESETRPENEAGNKSENEETAAEEVVSDNEEAAGKNNVSDDEEAAGKNNVLDDEEAAGKNNVSDDEETAGKNNVSDDEEAAGKNNVSDDDETAGKNNVSDDEEAAEKKNVSDDQEVTEEENVLDDQETTPEENVPDSETPGGTPYADLAPEIHEHNWSSDWSCDESGHWHECGAENCPAADSSEKDGYAEHCYGDDGPCIECGYYKAASPRFARAAQGAVPTYQEAYDAMIALQEQYPEGMAWTNFTPYGSDGPLGDSYIWNGGSVYGANRGVGCSAFAFILSDAAFGSLPARTVSRGSFTFDDVKVGDILRVQNNSHSVIVLQKSAGGVVVAEGNYNKSVHWGRVLNEAEVLTADFIITRYPQGYTPQEDPDADKVAQNGTAGSLNWSLTNAGVLTVSGSGVIPDYTPDLLPPWNGCNISTIILEKGVTGIGNYAFYQSSALSVYIPDGVTTIGQNAFSGSSLLSVTIPGSVETIGDSAFLNCANLTSGTVSEGVKTIGEDAFRGCTSLAYIDFPASIISVGAGAFMSCDEMTRVRFMPGSGTAALGGGLFAQCRKLTSVTLPQTADCISDNMFQSCSSLPALYIPASVTTIGENPFTSCRALKYIYFGGTQTEWDNMATPSLKASLSSTGTTVICDVPFDDPFAADPNDPGDFQPGEENGGACTNHVDANSDGKCDNCGEAMPADHPDSDDSQKDPAVPDNSGKDPAVPDDGGKTPANPGSSESETTTDHQTGNTPGTSSSGGSDSHSGSSDSRSGSSGEDGGSGEPDRFSNLSWQYNPIQRQDEPSRFTARLTYPEVFSVSEDESDDTDSLSLPDQYEAEPEFDESPESGTEEVPQADEEAAGTESDNSSDDTDNGIAVPALIVSAAVVLGASFVFIRRKKFAES